LCVLAGQVRLILGDQDITMGPGEVAEFDTRLPHWFGRLLCMQGERIRVRAAPRRPGDDA
jgi:hypothetical protein